MTKSVHVARAQGCSACGGFFAQGREECQGVFDRYNGLAASDVVYGRVHRILVDAYCMQHLEPYCLSAKSYAAHLTGLCWGVRHGGEPAGYVAIQRWLNAAPELVKPPVLDAFWQLTLADVRQAADPDDYVDRVRAWAQHVWKAYSQQHDLAEHWLALAFAQTRVRR
jgi:hypothetical protein